MPEYLSFVLVLILGTISLALLVLASIIGCLLASTLAKARAEAASSQDKLSIRDRRIKSLEESNATLCWVIERIRSHPKEFGVSGVSDKD